MASSRPSAVHRSSRAFDSPADPRSFTVQPDAGLMARLASPTKAALWSAPASPVRQLLHPLAGATFDRTRGAALLAAIDALPAERRALGIGGFTPADLASVDENGERLCDYPHLLATVEEGGATYELSLVAQRNIWLSDLHADAYALDAECVDALLAAGGDVASVVGEGCTDADERAHFRAGSDCRTCLEVDGDHGRCVAASACPAEAVRRVQGGGAWFDAYAGTTLYCAPDLTVPAVVLADEGTAVAGVVPLFDSEVWVASCVYLWSDAQGAPTLACATTDNSARDTVGDFVLGIVDTLTDAGGNALPATGRVALMSSVEVEGTTYDATYLFLDTFGGLSSPLGSSEYAWGFSPYGLRPGGTDPNDPADTWAREYIATASLKSASTINGIFVWGYHVNRCADGGWTAPDANGSSTCLETGPWGNDAPRNDDGFVAFYGDDGQSIYTFPHTTLAATGLPDPTLPGGLVPHVIGSTTLADEGWEACAWPQTFVPDRMRALDTAQINRADPYASFDAETYRFGRDPSVDVIMALATEQKRDYCFTPPP